MLHVGLDEAGYGPLLGPLVIGLSAFRTADDDTPLARRLQGLVVRRPRRRKNGTRKLPVPIDDSKEIHRRFGREGLARGVHAFFAARGEPPVRDLEDLLRRCSDEGPESFRHRAWYTHLDGARLPEAAASPRLDARFLARGVEAVALRVLPVDAARLNDAFDRHDNKARVLGIAAGGTLLRLLDAHPGEDARVVFDRQGARLDYGPYLADLFPFAQITSRPAPEGESHYDVVLPSRRLDIRFVTKGDRHALTVAWASMAAKLVRELFMDLLNDFFLERCPELRPTRGYVQDGRRFLADVDAVIHAEQIAARELVRSR